MALFSLQDQHSLQPSPQVAENLPQIQGSPTTHGGIKGAPGQLGLRWGNITGPNKQGH